MSPLEAYCAVLEGGTVTSFTMGCLHSSEKSLIEEGSSESIALLNLIRRREKLNGLIDPTQAELGDLSRLTNEIVQEIKCIVQ